MANGLDIFKTRKKNRTGTILIIAGIAILAFLLFFAGDKGSEPLLQIDSYYDSGKNLIPSNPPLTVVNGVENVGYIKMKVTLENVGENPFLFSINKLKPTNLAFTEQNINVNPGEAKFIVTDFIDVTPYESNTATEFCVDVDIFVPFANENRLKTACLGVDINPSDIELGPIGGGTTGGTTGGTGGGGGGTTGGSGDEEIIVIPEEPDVNNSAPTNPPCTENWVCNSWSSCSMQGEQNRICTDQNNCGTFELKPSETQTCNPPPPPEVCGNNVCESMETSNSCPADCAPPPETVVKFRTTDLSYGTGSKIAYSNSCGGPLSNVYTRSGISGRSSGTCSMFLSTVIMDVPCTMSSDCKLGIRGSSLYVCWGTTTSYKYGTTGGSINTDLTPTGSNEKTCTP